MEVSKKNEQVRLKREKEKAKKLKKLQCLTEYNLSKKQQLVELVK